MIQCQYTKYVVAFTKWFTSRQKTTCIVQEMTFLKPGGCRLILLKGNEVTSVPLTNKPLLLTFHIFPQNYQVCGKNCNLGVFLGLSLLQMWRGVIAGNTQAEAALTQKQRWVAGRNTRSIPVVHTLTASLYINILNSPTFVCTGLLGLFNKSHT